MRWLTKLTCGGFDPESAAMPPGGVERLTSQDIAAALSFAGVSRMAHELGRAKFCGDGDARARVFALVGGQVRSALEAWAIRDKTGLAQRLTEILVLEYVDSPRCHRCNGAGERKHRGVWQSCPTCQGSGQMQITDAYKARQLGVHKSNYTRTWGRRYLELARPITEAEHELARVAPQLRSEPAA